MATIENRSVYIVTVLNRVELTKTFAYTRKEGVKAYIAELKAAGYKPKLSRKDDSRGGGEFVGRVLGRQLTD